MGRDRVVVVGDVVNDVIVAPRGEIRRDTDTSSTIRPRPGGSGANTATWLGSLGGAVDFVGCVGAADAEYHAQLFREHGVEPHLQVELGLPTGTIVILLDGEERTMLTERGANAALRSATVTDELLAAAGLVLVSGYSILDGFPERDVRDLLERAAAAGAPVAVTLGSVGYLADFGVPAYLELVGDVDLVFANLDEARLVTGEQQPDRIAQELGVLFRRVVLTLGAEGSLVIERGRQPVAVPAMPVRMVDPTGAGDAFAAGFLHRLMQVGTFGSAELVAAAEAGAFVAARAVMVMGGRPPI
jgi:sugar/nucleoside kinase (ribokinase family)